MSRSVDFSHFVSVKMTLRHAKPCGLLATGLVVDMDA